MNAATTGARRWRSSAYLRRASTCCATAAAEMIAAGASPRALQVTLGHASASFSLTTYGFDADLEALATALEERRTARRGPPAASSLPGHGLRPARTSV